MLISFIGEILNNAVPLPIPASIYGIIILFAALELKIVKLDSVKKTGTFLIEIMPIMFIPAAVGLVESWNILKSEWIQYLLVTIVSTVLVMVVAGKVTQFVIRRKIESAVITMSSFLQSSVFFGVFVSVFSYFLGMALQRNSNLRF